MKFLFPNACLIYHLSNYKGDTLKHAIFTALFFIFVFYVLSCVSPGIDGRYAVDLEETKKILSTKGRNPSSTWYN
jgi:hypothetical protein